jgi:hypothetical protein
MRPYLKIAEILLSDSHDSCTKPLAGCWKWGKTRGKGRFMAFFSKALHKLPALLFLRYAIELSQKNEWKALGRLLYRLSPSKRASIAIPIKIQDSISLAV